MTGSRATVRLFAAAEVRLGRQRSPQHEFGSHMTAYLRAANVKDGKLDLSDVKRMNFDPTEQEIFTLRGGDILVTEGSGSLTAVGASAVWNEELPGPVCFQNTLIRLRPRIGVDGNYLGWWARSAYASGQFANIAYGASIWHVSAERLKALPMTLPSCEEQKRIAAFLDVEQSRFNQLVDVLTQTRRALRERRDAALLDLVSGGLHASRKRSNLSWVETLPQDWVSVKLSYVARLGSGHTPSRSRPDWWMDCTIPWVTTGEVSQMRSDRLETLRETREKISQVGLENSAAEVHPKGTVVLCRTAASAGYSAVIGNAMATSQDIATWTCGSRLDPFYLLWCLRAMRTDLLDRLAFGSTHKTIYMPDLQTLRIPLPPLGEQRRIVEEIRCVNSQVDPCIDALGRQLDLLAERRKALIAAAVSGQIDITTARGADV